MACSVRFNVKTKSSENFTRILRIRRTSVEGFRNCWWISSEGFDRILESWFEAFERGRQDSSDEMFGHFEIVCRSKSVYMLSTFLTLSKGSIGISSHIDRLHVDITSFLSDLTPQLLSTIESDFEKVADEAAPTPTRIGADTVVATPAASASAGGTKGKAAAANDVDPMDELFPRVDFDRLVPGATVSALGDANWKVRKEAVEAIRDVLEANKRIKPTTLREFQVLVRIRNSSLIEAG